MVMMYFYFTDMPTNVEIKARVNNVDKLTRLVKAFSDSSEATELNQEDTFFNVNNGRLKLREIKVCKQLTLPCI